ncbi:MAG: hypothetical protein SGARI_006978 [Bacillariaceae sp.]
MIPTNADAKPKEGEYRVLIRMLPVKPTDEQKKKRADCHIWPKGTFLVVDTSRGKFPQILEQAKQQSWDTTYWVGLSKHLDVTPMIKHLLNPTRTNKLSIEMCCHDDQQYYFSVAVCKYVSPSGIQKRLLAPNNPYMKRLSLDASYAKAIAMMQNNEVVLDSDDEGDAAAKGGMKRLTFSLKDPATKTGIDTPCFDLGTWLGMNETVSGQRFKCLHCENWLSFKDLELCELTAKALIQFSNQVSAQRHMVELREDKSMNLLAPVKAHSQRQRPNKKKKKANGNTNARNANNPSRGEPEVIDLLDD